MKATFFEVGTTERGSELNKAIQEADLTGFMRGSFKWCSVLADRIADALASRPAADESAKPTWLQEVIDYLDGCVESGPLEDDGSIEARRLLALIASTASKEAVLSDDARDAARYRLWREGWDQGELLDAVLDARLAQRDASKAEQTP